MSRTITLLAFLAVLFSTAAAVTAAEDRRERVLTDRQNFGTDPHWIYNDFDRASALAAETRKPMLVVLRCIP